MTDFTVVYYFCPEDGDDQTTPNAFGLPKALNKVEYKDLVEHFPLKGEYVFRAKLKQGKEVLWYDLDRFSPKIPTDDGAIFLKVKRITWETPIHRQSGVQSGVAGQSTVKAETGGKSVGLSQKADLLPTDLDLGLLGGGRAEERPAGTGKVGTQGWSGTAELDLSGFGFSPSTAKPAQSQSNNLFQDLL